MKNNVQNSKWKVETIAVVKMSTVVISRCQQKSSRHMYASQNAFTLVRGSTFCKEMPENLDLFFHEEQTYSLQQKECQCSHSLFMLSQFT